MVYKKFKDFKLEIIRLIFTAADPSAVISRIEELEASGSITPSQVQTLTSIFYESEIYKFKRNTNMSEMLADRLGYETMIMVYKRKIIASYIPSEGRVYLE